MRVKRKSLRAGVWFRALEKMERGIIDLTIKCVDKVRSKRLALALANVLSKLFSALRSRFLTTIERLGRPLAAGLSDAAYTWGNVYAFKWRFDVSFIRWVGLNQLSNSGWRMVG